MTPNDMTAALTREPTTEERHQHQLGFASYQAWTAGVAWAAEHGHGDWDDAEQAWATWWETTAPAPKF